MQLAPDQVGEITKSALSYLGRPYSKDWRCVDFVRAVYQDAGMNIPPLMDYAPPPEFNIATEQLIEPPTGCLMFLKDRNDPRKKRAWTHVVIVLTTNTCIHCSIFYGNKVVISTFEEIFLRYDFVESKQTA